MDANEHKYYYFYLCLSVFIRGFLYPLSYFQGLIQVPCFR